MAGLVCRLNLCNSSDQDMSKQTGVAIFGQQP